MFIDPQVNRNLDVLNEEMVEVCFLERLEWGKSQYHLRYIASITKELHLMNALSHDKSPNVSMKASATGAVAVGAFAIGALALGALAIGSLAIGRLAIGRLSVRKLKLKSLEVEELTVSRLRIKESTD
jgi:hypothetical protein